MIHDLKPYAAYKDSGESWLGPIPEHWDTVRTKSILQERSIKGFPNEPLLAATQTKGVVRKGDYENRTVLAMKDLHLLKLVREGDFVISLRSFQGGIEYARHQGIISPAYTILYPAIPQNHGYLAHLFKSQPYIGNLGLFVTGIRQGQNIDYTKLGRSYLPLPPPEEQAAIVRFLDRADRHIRRSIRAKRKLIALLNEQKQVIIHQAVTRGLDPNVQFKPSGVEWLGDVPEHWEIARLGRVIKLTTGFPFKSDGFTQTESDIRLLRGINISPGQIRWNDVVRWPEADCKSFDNFEMVVGDIVLGMDRPIISSGVRVTAITGNDTPSLLLQRVARIRPTNELSSEFLLLLLSGRSFSSYLAPIFTGISVPHISPEQIGAFRFALPSNFEQEAIVERVKKATAHINTAIEFAQKNFSVLLELRTRLISDVVTGKLDVREAAAQLPADEPAIESADDTEAILEDDDTPEDAEPQEVEA